MTDCTETDAEATAPAAVATRLGALVQDLAGTGDDAVDRVLQILLQAARTHLDMEIGFVSEFKGERRYFRLVDETSHRGGTLQAGASDPREETYCQLCVDGRLPRIIQDAQALPAALELPVTRAMGIGAHLSAPITLADGSVYGTFCCFSLRADPELNEQDLGYLHAFADVAAELIQHETHCRRHAERKRAAIEKVLARGGIEPVWQPIVAAADDTLMGFEALARFPECSDIGATPDRWFDEAAALGLAERLECAAIDCGLQLLPERSDTAFVSVNASAKALQSGAMAALLESWPLERVVLEVTEHDVVEDYELLVAVLSPLRQRGLRLAVDDVGAGYASLRHVLKLEPDILKIDLGIIRDVDRDQQRQSLIRGLVAYASMVGCTVVAEGVETEGERSALQELDVDAVQGFLIARPASGERLAW